MRVTRRGECINVGTRFVTLPILYERPSAGNVAANGSSVFAKCPSINAGAAECSARANFKVYPLQQVRELRLTTRPDIFLPPSLSLSLSFKATVIF